MGKTKRVISRQKVQKPENVYPLSRKELLELHYSRRLKRLLEKRRDHYWEFSGVGLEQIDRSIFSTYQALTELGLQDWADLLVRQVAKTKPRFVPKVEDYRRGRVKMVLEKAEVV